jgi:catechol 2,3-dioxygenase-like lactoylglutathione lyase family enzyme
MRLRRATVAVVGIVLACPSLAERPATGAAQPPAAGAGQPYSKLISVSFPTTDLGRSVAFYKRFLGLSQARVIENEKQKKIRLDFPNGGPGLLIIQDKGARGSVSTIPRVGRMNLEVADLRELQASLSAAGYKFAVPMFESKEYHVLGAVLNDPDGNELELIQRVP